MNMKTYIKDWQFPEGEENKWYALAYTMVYNSRSCRYDTEWVKLIMLDGKGWNKSTECRKFLKDRCIWSYKDENSYKKIIVKKLSDLRPILEGKVEISYGPSDISILLGSVDNYQTKIITTVSL